MEQVRNENTATWAAQRKWPVGLVLDVRRGLPVHSERGARNPARGRTRSIARRRNVWALHVTRAGSHLRPRRRIFPSRLASMRGPFCPRPCPPKRSLHFILNHPYPTPLSTPHPHPSRRGQSPPLAYANSPRAGPTPPPSAAAVS